MTIVFYCEYNVYTGFSDFLGVGWGGGGAWGGGGIHMPGKEV